MYCNDEAQRLRHCGIVMWLDEVLAGFLESSYVTQAHQALGINQPPPDPQDGTPWMESDGF